MLCCVNAVSDRSHHGKKSNAMINRCITACCAFQLAVLKPDKSNLRSIVWNCFYKLTFMWKLKLWYINFTIFQMLHIHILDTHSMMHTLNVYVLTLTNRLFHYLINYTFLNLMSTARFSEGCPIKFFKMLMQNKAQNDYEVRHFSLAPFTVCTFDPDLYSVH